MEESKIKEELGDVKKTEDEPIQISYNFRCALCNVNEKVHYKGTTPPFSRNIVLKYPSYIMKDPFSPPGKGEILVLGADCSVCDRPVCVSKHCSLFFVKTFCLDCAKTSIHTFPIEIKNKVVQLREK
ncbi:hypothetical protein K1T71_010888 [Dendrolimus kikuchii]|uniref:Uncharacterized protein n=1 Tax=Dendrolimus kikuchii TaxID=765133 RepID=A0ACC1CQT9_9NEOP|nr:hypothetical protein K1T71_010888 [Dendrolimus kikuchii]